MLYQHAFYYILLKTTIARFSTQQKHSQINEQSIVHNIKYILLLRFYISRFLDLEVMQFYFITKYSFHLGNYNVS